MPTDPTIADDEREDKDGDDVLRRLTSVANICDRAAARLDRISDGFQAPPEPDKKAVIEQLNRIVAAANHEMSVADALLRKLRG